MKIQFKKISFNESLKYFVKDKEYYKPLDCHMNTYNRFYDRNYNVVEMRSSDFKYVTGLMTYKDNSHKYCVIHSWIEDRGMVLDLTAFANSPQLFIKNFSEDSIESTKSIMEERISYIPYYTISNNAFTKKCQEIACQCFFNEKRILEQIETFLVSIVKSLEDDISFIKLIKNNYGFIFKKEGFKFFIE